MTKKFSSTMQITYWLDLFTHQTWTEFLDAGGQVSGFRENRWKTLQTMNSGDILLCYLTGVSRWIGLLEVTGPAFQDDTPIWSANDFQARIPVKLIAKLDALTGVPVIEMKEKLSIFQNLKSPHAWTGRFRGSPYRWKSEDGAAVVTAILDAVIHPVERPFELAKLNKMPPILKLTKGGPVTVPDDESQEEVSYQKVSEHVVGDSKTVALDFEPKEVSAHTEIQWLLLKLGSDMGLDAWHLSVFPRFPQRW
jgi:hypothetical protein